MVTVSIVVAAWNAEKTILSCLDSLLAQQDVGVEIIVVDDCSSDNTFRIASGHAAQYPQIIVLQTPQNGGPAKARNAGIERCSGEWIAIVDADDRIDAGRLSKMVRHTEESKADICFDNLVMIEEGSKADPHAFIDDSHKEVLGGRWDVPFYTNFNRPYESPVLLGFLKPLLRADFLRMHNLSYSETLYNSEDYILILEALLCGAKIVYLHEALYRYYIYPASLSGKFNPDAHKKLIAVEQGLLEKYNDRMDTRFRKAIQGHIQSLTEAGVTNEMFSLLRKRQLPAVGILLANNIFQAHKHITRLTQSAARKFFSKNNRGS